MSNFTRLKKAVLTGFLGLTGFVSFGQLITVGAGTTTTSNMTDTPYGTFYMDDRTQLLYTAAEINAAGGYAGFISSVAFNVTGLASMSMNNFTVSIGTTNLTNLFGGYAPTTLTSVWTGTATTTIGWNTYTFTTPYFWDGTSNLVIDVCFDNSSWSSPSGTVRADFMSGGVYSLYTDNAGGSICGTTGGFGGNGSFRAQAQFAIVPPYQDDAGIAAILNPSLPTCDLDSIDITVVVTNSGQDTLTTCDIKWQIGNGTPTTVSYTGSVAPQGGTDTVVLANYSFVNGNELTVWTENPNGQQDSLPGNDTASMVVATGLAGTYDIPGDYATISAAATALSTFGVCGDVVMEIATGTYNEAVVLGNILGASEDATVTFTSATGNSGDVMISYSSLSTADNYVVYLDGSDWVTFTDVTIKNNSTGSFSTAVRLANGATNNTFDNCHIKAGTIATTGNSSTAIFSSGMNHNLTLTNNRIEKGGYGLYIWGQGITSKVENIIIENNLIEDAYYFQNDLWYIDGLEFNNNIVTNDSNLYLLSYAVRAYYVDDINMKGNYVGTEQAWLNNPIYGGYTYGIFLSNCLGANNPRGQISNNCITVGAPGSTTYGYYGLYLTQSGILDVHHNTVTRAGGSMNFYAGYITGGGAISLMNNNFVDYQSGYALYAPGIFTISTTDYNNFYSNGSNLVYFGTSIYSNLTAYQDATGNDMHSLSTDPAFVDTLGCITCNDTLDNAGFAGMAEDIDGNVRSTITPDIGAVEWVSPSNFTLGGDSTYCADEVTIEAGPAQSVTWSVNGNSSSAPTLTLNSNGVTTTYNVLVSIQTEFCGSATDNALITLVPGASLDSNVHICAEATATLNPGGAATSTFTWSTGASTQSLVVNAPGSYSVTKDEQGCISTASTIVTQSEAVQILGTEVCDDDLPLNLDATIANGTSYAWSGGNAPTSAVNTFTTGGPYTVTATDAFGCSSIDSFEVVILEEPNAVIGIQSNSGTIYIFDASGSSFLTSSSLVTWDFGVGAVPQTSNNVMETVTYPWPNPSSLASYSVNLEINNGCGIDIATQIVTPDPLSVEELEVGQFAIFPNPASDVVTIATNEVGAGSIQILDMSGRVVNQVAMNAGSNNHVINVSELASGTYIIKVMNDDASQMKQLIVQ